MLFICEKCGCIDDINNNNNFHNILYGFESFEDNYYNEHLCCTACIPRKYKDGVWTLGGQWHDYFKQQYYYELDSEYLEELTNLGILYNGKNFLNK